MAVIAVKSSLPSSSSSSSSRDHREIIARALVHVGERAWRIGRRHPIFNRLPIEVLGRNRSSVVYSLLLEALIVHERTKTEAFALISRISSYTIPPGGCRYHSIRQSQSESTGGRQPGSRRHLRERASSAFAGAPMRTHPDVQRCMNE